MEMLKYLFTVLLTLAVAVPETFSEEITPRREGSVKPPLVVNPIDHLTSDRNTRLKVEKYQSRTKRENNKNTEKTKGNEADKPKPPPNFNPLEDLILNQDKNNLKPASSSLSRVKRQYSDSESNSIETVEDISDTSNSYEDDEGRYPYPYPYPIPIFIGGGFGGFGGRGFGGRGFGGRGFGGGFGGRGFGGRGFGGGFGGRGFGGGFGGRGIGGGFGGGRGGGGGRG